MTDVPDGLLRQLARVRFRGVGCSRHRLAVDSRSQPEVCRLLWSGPVSGDARDALRIADPAPTKCGLGEETAEPRRGENEHCRSPVIAPLQPRAD